MLQFTPYASSSKGNMAIAEDGESRLMLDCGIPWRQARRLLQFRTSGIAGALITHFHADHSRAVVDAMKAGVDCYMSSETIEELQLSGHRLREINAMETATIGSWSVLAFDVEHDCPGAVGFLCTNREGEKLLYLADSAFCKYRFSGLSVIAIECNYDLDILRSKVRDQEVDRAVKRRVIRSHFSIENVIEMLKANDLSKVTGIWLLHLSDSNSDAEAFKQRVQATTGIPTYIA